MSPLGYLGEFRKFEPAIERASLAIESSGIDAGQHISARTADIEVGFGARSVLDYRLTRYGAYHVALSGDPRKPGSRHC